jgi:hypothetical protein
VIATPPPATSVITVTACVADKGVAAIDDQGPVSRVTPSSSTDLSTATSKIAVVMPSTSTIASNSRMIATDRNEDKKRTSGLTGHSSFDGFAKAKVATSEKPSTTGTKTATVRGASSNPFEPVLLTSSHTSNPLRSHTQTVDSLPSIREKQSKPHRRDGSDNGICESYTTYERTVTITPDATTSWSTTYITSTLTSLVQVPISTLFASCATTTGTTSSLGASPSIVSSAWTSVTSIPTQDAVQNIVTQGERTWSMRSVT